MAYQRRAYFLLLSSVFSMVLSLEGCIRICGFDPDDLEKWYVVQSPTQRSKKVDCDRVAFLESEPTGRRYTVVGLIAPPDGEFSSYAETINAIRALAAVHGADAVFVVSEQSGASWSFSAGAGGASGGSKEKIRVRAKAIVWAN